MCGARLRHCMLESQAVSRLLQRCVTKPRQLFFAKIEGCEAHVPSESVSHMAGPDRPVCETT